MTIQAALLWAKRELKTSGAEGAEPSSEYLLAQVLDVDKTYLFTHPEYELSAKQLALFESWIARRAKHEPVWYITGKIEFLGLEFVVDQNVLIPRPETELLIEKLVEHLREGFSPKSVLDVGTGSGVIIISLAKGYITPPLSSLVANPGISSGPSDLSVEALAKPEGDPRIRKDDGLVSFFASDISREALSVAKRNAKSLGFGKHITFKHGDLFEPWNGQKFDLIVANLPYVPEEDHDTLAPDLIKYEPHLALFAGESGLATINRFIEELPKYLASGGKAFLEIGYTQGDKIVEQVYSVLPEAKVEVLGDYAGIDRIVIIET